ncbi:MAG: filamentous hemagglutinin N-terminal domain-containing protein, partial [Caulobacteraceae bacterium]
MNLRTTTALRRRLMCSAGLSVALCGLPAVALAGASPALPTGGSVAAGSASISSPAGGALNIQQSSSRAIINWSSFSIGQGASVIFNNGSGATLNRVSSGGPISSLNGALSATGSVYLINPSGVIVGKSGVINVGGTFVASTQDITDSGFLAGGALTFNGGSNGAVINYGRIGALGGDVVLIASQVQNQGTISAPSGAVGLLAGYQVLLKDQADANGYFSVLVGGTGTSVTNAGAISAAAAELRAEQGNIYALAGNTTGVIRATEVSGA